MVSNVMIHPGPPITVTPPKQPVKKNKVDEVVWHCAGNCSFSVDFPPNNSPFNDYHFDQGKSNSGPVKDGAKLGEYKYNVTVGSDTLDPHIIVTVGDTSVS